MRRAVLRFSNIGFERFAVRPRKNLTRSYTSALFIPGNKAHETFSLLSPYLDFDERFNDMSKLRREMEQRGTKINVDELGKTWEFYTYIRANKYALEHRKNEIANKIKELKKKKVFGSEEESEMKKLMTQGKVLKQDMRMIKEALWELEESIVVDALKMPNEIDEKTPPKDSIILNKVGKVNESIGAEMINHLDIGTSLGLIDYKNPLNFYLCNEAALFELAAMSYAEKFFEDGGTIRIAGTDFARSLVVEACGVDHQDPSKAFVLLNNEDIDRESCNRLHLVGGASLISFLTMHTKQLINPKHFPLRYLATGRQYAPYADEMQENGLFTVCQSSVVQVFSMVQDPASVEYNNEFEKLLASVAAFYDSLDVHYRSVMRSANELNPWESHRVSYEMWSSSLNDYVEIGHVSLCGRYLSKRLLIAYQTPNGRNFPAIISGTVVSIPKLLACLLEQDQKFWIPRKIAKHMQSFY